MKLDEALRTASSSLDDVARSAPDREVPAPPKPTRTKAALAAVMTVAAVGGAVAVNSDRPGSVTVASDATVDGPRRLASSNVPSDMELRFAGPTALLGSPGRVQAIQVYADESQPGRRLTIGHAPSGAFRIPIAGEPIELAVGTARSAPGESLVVVDTDSGQLLVDSPHLTEEEMLTVIESLSFEGDGSPTVLAEPPDGLTMVGSIRRAWFEQLPLSVDLDAEIVSYVGAANRHLTVSVVSNASSNWPTVVKLDDFVVEEVGGRSVHAARHDQFVQLIWVDGQSLIRVGAVGMTETEIGQAVKGLALSGTTILHPGDASDESASATSPAVRSPVPVLGDASRPLSDGLPAGFRLAANPSQLGEGAPVRTDVLLYEGTSSRTIRIEIIEDGGVHPEPEVGSVDIDGVVISHTMDPANNVAVFQHGARSVKISAGLSSEHLLDLVEDVLATDLTAPQLADAAATPLFSSTQVARWTTPDGSTIIGPANAWNAAYMNETDATVVISSQAITLGYPPSVLHNGSASIDLGSVDGVLSPDGQGWKIEFVTDGRLLTISGTGVNTQQLLDVISGLHSAE